jgi:hypothetical protein
MNRRNRECGLAAMTVLFVVTTLVLTSVALTGLTGSSIIRSKREVKVAQAFIAAQAGVDYEFQQQLIDLEANHGTFVSTTRNLAATGYNLPSGGTGTITVSPIGDGSQAWITCSAYVGTGRRSVRVLMKAKDVGIWNNAIFAGTGASGQSINGNVDIRGSVHLLGDGEAFNDLNGNGVRDAAETFTDSNHNGVRDPGEPFVDANGDGVWNPAEPYNDSNGNGAYDPPLTITDLNSTLSGNAYIGNNYQGMPAGLLASCPSITDASGVNTLGTEVRCKNGRIGLSGSAYIGSSTNTSTNKFTVDGTYVSDGWAGNQGSAHVCSDNGFNNGYDLGDRVTFPYITGIGSEPITVAGITYATFKDYLDSKSMTVNISSITTSMAAVTYGPDANGNKLEWVAASGGNPAYLKVTGIVKIAGNLSLGTKNTTVYYQGKGTLYSTGSIDVHCNLLPYPGKIFPTGTALGMVAVNNINLATGNGDSQLQMAGAFYAQGTIKSAKQNQILGTFVANYYDMGSNVPNIYQVPSLAKNLPPGMPGDKAIISLARKTWRERVPPSG